MALLPSPTPISGAKPQLSSKPWPLTPLPASPPGSLRSLRRAQCLGGCPQHEPPAACRDRRAHPPSASALHGPVGSWQQWEPGGCRCSFAALVEGGMWSALEMEASVYLQKGSGPDGSSRTASWHMAPSLPWSLPQPFQFRPSVDTASKGASCDGFGMRSVGTRQSPSPTPSC